MAEEPKSSGQRHYLTRKEDIERVTTEKPAVITWLKAHPNRNYSTVQVVKGLGWPNERENKQIVRDIMRELLRKGKVVIFNVGSARHRSYRYRLAEGA
jgi:hypothetical protein